MTARSRAIHSLSRNGLCLFSLHSPRHCLLRKRPFWTGRESYSFHSLSQPTKARRLSGHAVEVFSSSFFFAAEACLFMLLLSSIWPLDDRKIVAFWAIVQRPGTRITAHFLSLITKHFLLWFVHFFAAQLQSQIYLKFAPSSPNVRAVSLLRRKRLARPHFRIAFSSSRIHRLFHRRALQYARLSFRLYYAGNSLRTTPGIDGKQARNRGGIEKDPGLSLTGEGAGVIERNR